MSFWHKLAKIAAFAAPIAAAPFTGGASLALIGAGAGAANGLLDHKGLKGTLLGAGLGAGSSYLGGKALGHIPGMGGAAHAASGASGVIPDAVAGIPEGILKSTMQNSGKSGMSQALGKVFGKGGIDPTTALLGGLSMLGGDDGPQKLSSYQGHGLSDPVTSMNDSMSAIRNLAGQMSHNSGQSVAPPPPRPISVPGLPFQIGGSLGADPSMFQTMKMTNPFEGSAQPASSPKPTSRRRPE